MKHGGAREILGTYIFFGMRLALPLIALPLFSHILSPGDMGDLLAAQSLGLLGSIFIQYGFHQSAPRELSLTSDLAEHRLIASRVVQCQLVNGLVASLVIAPAIVHSSRSDSALALAVSAVITAIGTGLSPAWYFRGTTRTARGMAIDFAGQGVAVVLVLLSLLLPMGVGMIAILYATGPLLSSLAGLLAAVKEVGGLSRIPLRDTLSRLRFGLDLFYLRASSSLLTTGSVWLVSIMASSAQAAYFGIASKLVGAATSLTQPVIFSVMPRIAKAASGSTDDALVLVRKYGGLLLAQGALCALALQIAAPLVISLLFSENMAPAQDFVRILGWICIPMALRETLGDLTLVPFHADRKVSRSIIWGAGLGLVAAIVAIPQTGAWGMVIARGVAEAAMILLMAYAIRSEIVVKR